MHSFARRRAASARAASLAARWLFTLMAVVCAPASAIAQATESVTIAWSEAPGAVVGYDVYVSIDDAEMFYHARVSEAEVVISGAPFQSGDSLRFQVVGVAADSSQGPPSEISDVVYFPNVPAPVGLSADDGSARYPTLVSWDPVPHAESYVIFRSAVAGQPGSYVGRADVPWLEDATGDLDVVYHYSVAAINGRQVSDFSGQVAGTRGGTYPGLAALPSSLDFSVRVGDPANTQVLRLTNTGDWELSYTAWPTAPWLSVTPNVGDVDDVPVDVNVTVTPGALSPGVHQAFVQVYVYYQPPPGETFQLGPAVMVPVSLTISAVNGPPVIESALSAAVAEGQIVQVAITASDPDPGDRLDVAMGQLPDFASFESLGDGLGQLTLAPGYEDAGSYQPVVVAWDNAHYVVEPFALTVADTNRPPQAAMVPDTTIATDTTSFILVFAWDPDLGDRIAFSTSALPDFATFTDLGNGTGQFQFDPTGPDVGDYLIVLGVVDDGTPVGFVGMPFRLTVEP
jgi:hypothetical protein